MSVEIERKFLIGDGWTDWINQAASVHNITQGYLSYDPTIRVRLVTLPYPSTSIAYITIKGKQVGITRSEYEYDIPIDDAINMLKELCSADHIINKKRYLIPHDGNIWHVDIYGGNLLGLKTAEIELEHECESFTIPTCITHDISDMYEYTNASIALNGINPHKYHTPHNKKEST